MNNQSRSKVLVIIIAALIIANIVSLSLFFSGRHDHKPGRPDKKEAIAAYLKNEVGFTITQLSLYDTLSNRNREEAKSLFDEMAAHKEMILKKLASQSFSDAAIDQAAAEINLDQKNFEVKMLKHLEEIRSLCTPEQLLRFDTGFYKIIGRRPNEKSPHHK